MRSRLRVALAVALFLAAASACSTEKATAPLPGTALHAGTFGGVPQFNFVRSGERLGVAFPILKNETTMPITIYRVGLRRVPAGVQITGYRAISLRSGFIVLSVEGSGTKFDYLHYRNEFVHHHLTIPARAVANFYFVADLVSKRSNPGIARGFDVFYRDGDVRYVQHFPCEYSLGPFHGG